MDEGLLNDLLECSVCLERLDTSSRVLPCQHTFCLKCLKVIVQSRKELRCPECRVLVEVKVEDLPPNVLLMRILEGMNQPWKAAGSQRAPKANAQVPSQQPVRDGKAFPPHGRALYDFNSKEPGDLTFKKGDMIVLQKKLDGNWYHGECSGRTGIFPICYLQVLIPLPAAPSFCKALYDFRMTGPDEEGCLAFDKGEIITVQRRVDENWAEGRLDQRVGIFPLAFVELNANARQLLYSSTLNRPVPPVPPEQARAAHSDMARHHALLAHRYQQMSMSIPLPQQTYQNVPTMSQSHPNYHAQMPQQTPSHPQPKTNQMSNIVTAVPRNIIESSQAVPRNIIEPSQPKHSLDLIHFANVPSKSGAGTLVQSVSSAHPNNVKSRKSTKFDFTDTTYQNVRIDRFPQSVANFNSNISSDSSSSMNTPVGVSANTTPNSSDTSTSDSAEQVQSSDTTERNTLISTQNVEEATVEEPSRIEATRIEATRIEASRTEASRIEASRIEASRTETSRIEASRTEPSPNASSVLNESSTATNTSLNVSLPSDVSISNTEAEIERMSLPSSSNIESPRGTAPGTVILGYADTPWDNPAYIALARAYRDHKRDKRHSLTPSTHLHGNHTPNRHSAEILATSLLDTPEREREANRDHAGRERERRRHRSRSNERPLPASYIALYPYKPQKPDELELRKGAMYTVTERCRDGWYKGISERSQRSGVFPGNYVYPARLRDHKSAPAVTPTPAAPAPVTATVHNKPTMPPDLPPREPSPVSGQPMSFPWCSSPHAQAQPQQLHSASRTDKHSKQKPEKSGLTSGVSLMKRLAAMKKCKSPPPAYSMDNPVFEDTPGPSPASHQPPQHVRSGSCPSQLLRGPATDRRVRPQLHTTHLPRPSDQGPWQTQHRKSQSLDVTAPRKDKDRHPPFKERFRCIVPYPPNSEYELELKVDDIVIVSKKRGDGWYKGTLQRTGRTGLFPASFVQSSPE